MDTRASAKIELIGFVHRLGGKGEVRCQNESQMLLMQTGSIGRGM